MALKQRGWPQAAQKQSQTVNLSVFTLQSPRIFRLCSKKSN